MGLINNNWPVGELNYCNTGYHIYSVMLKLLRLEGIKAKNIGLVVIDLDGLKVVNDTLGHSIGDKLLLDAAKILIENVRDSDVVARIGGDEFVLLLPNCTLVVIETVCIRINKGISLYNENNHHYPLSLSFGTAIRDEALITMDELYRDADQNMYPSFRNSPIDYW